MTADPVYERLIDGLNQTWRPLRGPLSQGREWIGRMLGDLAAARQAGRIT
jgi:hypothetical protein